MSSLRNEIHDLVETLPEEELQAVRRFVAFVAREGDPFLRALRDAPIDDEPETDTERAAVAQANAEIARGEVFTLDEVRAELER